MENNKEPLSEKVAYHIGSIMRFSIEIAVLYRLYILTGSIILSVLGTLASGFVITFIGIKLSGVNIMEFVLEKDKDKDKMDEMCDNIAKATWHERLICWFILAMILFI